MMVSIPSCCHPKACNATSATRAQARMSSAESLEIRRQVGGDRANLGIRQRQRTTEERPRLKKADARFWDAVVARLAVPRAQMLMVGDDLDNDVLAPRRAGIASVWLNWKRAPTPAGVVVSMIERLDAADRSAAL